MSSKSKINQLNIEAAKSVDANVYLSLHVCILFKLGHTQKQSNISFSSYVITAFLEFVYV